MGPVRGVKKIIGWLAAIWGVGGVIVFLAVAIVRLSQISWDAFSYTFTGWQWVVLVAHTVFMAHAEGYKGFQKSFSPRLVARAQHLYREPGWLSGIAAPLFCMGYFGTTPRRLISIYVLTAFIVAIIVAFQYLPQPWRGILDVGVVVGLTWGVASILHCVGRLAREGRLPVSPELSGHREPESH
tara:strand:- start:510 stop:1061 length:552 start_codon:yes stop_codon:yes gene_type:complete